jgi:hypothetical protein
VAAQGRQPVAEATLGGEDAVLEAKETGIVGVAGMVELLQELRASPAVDDAPADQEEDGDGIEGDLPLSRGPTEALGQHVAQGAEVDQAEQEIEVGEMLPGGRVFEIPPTLIDVVGAVRQLGRGSNTIGDRPHKGQSMAQAQSCTER